MKTKIGLVLAGGGALGAYQAGVAKYLAEISFQPHIIAGTSIGALNGAVLASNKDFKQSSNLLWHLWDEVGNANVIRLNSTSLVLLVSYLTQITIPTFRNWYLGILKHLNYEYKNSVFDPKPVEQFLRKAVKFDDLKNGIDLWVAVFPSMKLPFLRYYLAQLAIDVLRAKAGQEAHWLRVQDAKDEEQAYSILLASAAIPLAFPEREINGISYVDGAIADNVPLGALAKEGCTHAIIVHLGNGEIWNRNDFPNQAIIEIRAKESFNKSGIPLFGDAHCRLDFSLENIRKLRECGYRDAEEMLTPILHAYSVENNYKSSLTELSSSTRLLLEDQL